MTKRIILIVIVLAMLSVGAGALTYLFAKPEFIGKDGLAKLATDYYENDFYDTILQIDTSSQPLAERLERYSKIGFAEVYLRQLLILKGEKYQKAATYLKKHCDENRTYVRYYPDSPYGRKDYHIEYAYSCNFE